MSEVDWLKVMNNLMVGMPMILRQEEQMLGSHRMRPLIYMQVPNLSLILVTSYFIENVISGIRM